MKTGIRRKSKTSNRTRCITGSSLVECLVTLLTMSIGMTGMINFRYYCVKQAVNANILSKAAYVGQSIAETWVSQNGSVNFNLTDYTFEDDYLISVNTSSIPEVPDDYIRINCYKIQSEGQEFLATLGLCDSDEVVNTRYLYIYVTWQDAQGHEQNHAVSAITQAQPLAPEDAARIGI
jgi:Tfp pilus assembly protein PilV